MFSRAWQGLLAYPCHNVVIVVEPTSAQVRDRCFRELTRRLIARKGRPNARTRQMRRNKSGMGSRIFSSFPRRSLFAEPRIGRHIGKNCHLECERCNCQSRMLRIVQTHSRYEMARKRGRIKRNDAVDSHSFSSQGCNSRFTCRSTSDIDSSYLECRYRSESVEENLFRASSWILARSIQ